MIFLIILNSLVLPDAWGINLMSAALCDDNFNNKSIEELKAGRIIAQSYKKAGIEMYSCFGWTNLGEGSIWYNVTDNLDINSIDIVQSKVLNQWELSSLTDCSITGNNDSCNDGWWSGRWSKDEIIEPEIIGRYPSTLSWRRLRAEIYGVDFMGCMQHTPLRYGDVDNNGDPELIVFLPNLYSVDMAIFSPSKKKTIFASKLDFNDVISFSDIKGTDRDYFEPTYQYYSRYVYDRNELSPGEKGYRSFAKIYTGDFDENGTPDILVWRKLYVSRLITDPVKGFELKGQMYGHYSLIDSEYKLQDTSAETVQNWLSTKNLTWQKGFPSLSECEGEEGQLIPEMHDPLLNDPDVLK